QRLAPGTETIVDRHGDQVDPDRVVFAHEAGDLELAADAVGTGDENGVAVVFGEEPAVVVEAEETGEPAETVEDTRRVRALEQRRHGRQALLVDVQIQSGVAVAQARRRFVRHPGTKSWMRAGRLTMPP